jgi:hypothetical protein
MIADISNGAEITKLLSRIERLETLVDELEHATSLERARIRDHMRRELVAVRLALKRLNPHNPTEK